MGYQGPCHTNLGQGALCPQQCCAKLCRDVRCPQRCIVQNLLPSSQAALALPGRGGISSHPYYTHTTLIHTTSILHPYYIHTTSILHPSILHPFYTHPYYTHPSYIHTTPLQTALHKSSICILSTFQCMQFSLFKKIIKSNDNDKWKMTSTKGGSVQSM